MHIKYHLDEDKEPDSLSPRSPSLSDGHLHWLRLSREGKDVYVQVSSQAFFPSIVRRFSSLHVNYPKLGKYDADNKLTVTHSP